MPVPVPAARTPAPDDLWQWADQRADSSAREPLVISLPNFEGPLGLLLDLARAERIDLARISILALAEQYLTYVETAQTLRLELAADYLLMAASLAYLKSLLLLPPEAKPDPDPQLLAEQLRWRLRRLQAMRDAADALAARPQLGRDIAARGAPEGLRCIVARQTEAELRDLLRAYARLRTPAAASWQPHSRAEILSLEQALAHLRARAETLTDWTDLGQLVPPARSRAAARSALASSFVAALELGRQQLIELAQDDAFAAMWVRRRQKSANPPATG